MILRWVTALLLTAFPVPSLLAEGRGGSSRVRRLCLRLVLLWRMDDLLLAETTLSHGSSYGH